MSINERLPIFRELINAESAVISGGAMPIFVYDGITSKILNVDGYSKEVTLIPTPPASGSSPLPSNDMTNLLGL